MYPKFALLLDTDQSKTAVNINNITHIQQYGAVTYIYFERGHFIKVEDTIENVLTLISDREEICSWGQ